MFKIENEPAGVKLKRIIDELKLNICNQHNGRQTSRNSDWKSNLLTAIQTRIDQEGNLSGDTLQHYIYDIRTACACKRNVLHFWAQTHSVKEFETLLQKEFTQEELTTHQLKL